MQAYEAQMLERGQRLIAAGDSRGAEAVFLEALGHEPNLPHIHLALANLRLPGPDYPFWLAWLHDQLNPKLYLEIGVEAGDSLVLAQPPTRAIGIDPAPVGDPRARCPAPTQIFPLTSAAFLANPPPESGLRETGFDLAFIDGDHSFGAVLADFIALERFAAPGAVIGLHDMLPLTPAAAAPQQKTAFYTGDGWKIILCLRVLRPDLRVYTIPTAPTGLTLVTGLNPQSTLLAERQADILAAYRMLPPDRAIDDPRGYLGVGVNDPAAVAAWLAAARQEGNR
jgi:catechol 2,3-dioxygenase-like lactoylglutathione lyase family enzyme